MRATSRQANPLTVFADDARNVDAMNRIATHRYEHASGVSDGNETRTDYNRMIKIVQEAGFKGYIGIEYEGKELAEPEGIKATKALLERVGRSLGA